MKTKTVSATNRTKKATKATKETRATKRLEKINARLDELDKAIAQKRRELESDEASSDYMLLCRLNEEIEALETEMLTLMEEAEELEGLLS